MWSQDYNDCLEYIDSYWNKIIFKPSRMNLKYQTITIPTFLPDKNGNHHFIYIPHPYFVPNDNKFKFIFYWDSFFMFRGLMGTKRESMMKHQVDNLIYLFNKYQIIPNFNAPASINRSQPPFFSSMILNAYLTPLNKNNPHNHKRGLEAVFYKLQNKKWLRNAIETAKKEYEIVWIDKANLYNHHVEGFNLARYGDRDIGYAHSSELESGWDMTSRYYNRCDHFLPIDLNTYLYKYEKDFATAAQILGDHDEEAYWNKRALDRQLEMNKYMWNDQEGFFFDYGYNYKQISSFYSLASFTPLWAGLATADQAKRIVEQLPKFETHYGLTITAKESLAQPIDLSKIQRRYHPAINEIIKAKQWDYPNIWSPLEYQTVVGLLKYGFVDDARRIMEKSVKTHAAVYRKYQTFAEKLNGETGEPAGSYHYSDQKGFGWTNAAFYRYIQMLDAIDAKKPLYTEPTAENAPYDLAILH